MTEKAVQKAREIAAEEGFTGCPLRVKVVGGGCAGFSYDLFFDDKEPSDTDETFNCEGVVLVVDPLSNQYLDNTTIDYVDGPLQSGFKFLNPNVKSTCGCGSSFSA